MSETILTVKNLEKHYKGFSLQDISFSLPKGYIMGYVGPNGAGKSTTMRLICQISRADKGEVLLDGMHYKEAPLLYKEKIGYVSAMPFFPVTMKIKDIAKLSKRFYPSFREEEFYRMVREWELPEKKKIMEFSSGMMVRLMFASVFARDTRLLILDEATNGLDILFREEILKILKQYIEDGEHSVLFATHMIEDLEQIADYIVLIEGGRILLQDEKENLTERYVVAKGIDEMLGNKEKAGYLKGVKQTPYGASALLEANDAVYLPAEAVLERPSVSQIMSYLLRKG